MKIRFDRDWKYAERGIHVTAYAKGTEHDVSDECARAAVTEGAGQPVKGPTKEMPAPTTEETPGKPGSQDESGTDEPVSSSPPDQASLPSKPATSKAKRKS